MSFRTYAKGLTNGLHADAITVGVISAGCLGLCGYHLGRMLTANPDSRVHIHHRLDGVPDDKQFAEGNSYANHSLRVGLAKYFSDKPMSLWPTWQSNYGGASAVKH